jgi:hypothetical protein
MTDDVRKLLGGYATGTLTDAEQQMLYKAALKDEKLFEALADEQALKEILDDPAGRALVLQAVQTPQFSIGNALRRWFERPRAKAVAATGVVLAVAIAVTELRDRPRDTYVAENKTIRVEAPGFAPQSPAAAPSAARPAAAPPSSAARPATQAARKPARSTSGQAKDEQKESLADSAPGVKAEEAVVSRPNEPVITAAAPVAVREEQPIPSDAFTQTAKSGSTELRYVLRKRSASGDFTPVPLTSQLGEGDEARLTVQVNEPGLIALTSDRAGVLSTAMAEPGRAFTLAIPSGSRTVALSFSRVPRQVVANTLVGGAAAQEREARAKAVAPAGRSAMVQTDQSARFQTAEPGLAPVISVEIKLNRK